MKIILLLITIGTVFSGKCPLNEVIKPCKCGRESWQRDVIICNSSIDHISEIFDLASKNLTNQQEKHFQLITLEIPANKSEKESTLNDNSFADFTFDQFFGRRIKKISNKAFGQFQSEGLIDFSCEFCSIQNPEPNYNIWSVLSQFSKLERVFLGSNVTEVPTNATKLIHDSNSKLRFISFISNPQNNSITIKSGAFQNLNALNSIRFRYYSSLKFEKEAFKLSQNNNKPAFSIDFSQSNLKGN